MPDSDPKTYPRHLLLFTLKLVVTYIPQVRKKYLDKHRNSITLTGPSRLRLGLSDNLSLIVLWYLLNEHAVLLDPKIYNYSEPIRKSLKVADEHESIKQHCLPIKR